GERLARRRTDVLEHQGEDLVHLDIVEADADERAELGVVLADGAQPERRAGGVDVEQPPVAVEELPVAPGDRLERGAPVGRVERAGLVADLGEGGVDHEVDELGAAGHVGVEGHRAAASPQRRRTACGSPTSPISAHSPAGCMPHSCSMCSPAELSAGKYPPRCTPVSRSTPLRWESGLESGPVKTSRVWSIIPTAEFNIAPCAIPSGSLRPRRSLRWDRGVILTIMRWPRHSTHCSRAN